MIGADLMSTLGNRERLEYSKQDHTDEDNEDDMEDVCVKFILVLHNFPINFGKWIAFLWSLHYRIY